jgi:hypothetical protein
MCRDDFMISDRYSNDAGRSFPALRGANRTDCIDMVALPAGKDVIIRT